MAFEFPKKSYTAGKIEDSEAKTEKSKEIMKIIQAEKAIKLLEEDFNKMPENIKKQIAEKYGL